MIGVPPLDVSLVQPPAKFKKPVSARAEILRSQMLVCGDKPRCLVELGRLGHCLNGQSIDFLNGSQHATEPATWELEADRVVSRKGAVEQGQLLGSRDPNSWMT